MDYKEVWNSKKPAEIGIQENKMWELSGKSLLEVLKAEGIHSNGDIVSVVETRKGTWAFIPD